MDNYEEYYNNFYKELLKYDKVGNTFSKIDGILPHLFGSESFLDIGCGYGSVSKELINRGFKVFGVEINDDALFELNKIGFETLKADITKPLNLDRQFDIVLILDVLEHLFDPVSLLSEAKKYVNIDGYIIINVPLYFDLLDRLKILFTGSVISMDNLCYGEENFKKFRSYNYDHIRFFRPADMIEMGNNLNLTLEEVQYDYTRYIGKNLLLKAIFKLISNNVTAHLFPNLFAHSMKIRWKVRKK